MSEMSEQPEALRLADELEKWTMDDFDAAAAELRRLHAENRLLHERHHDDNVEYTRVLAQRDALLEVLKYHQEQTRPIQRSIDAIKAVEEGK